uniref:Uncharacterized protein n=1 Tax=Avena sativa TaxID=4498 RepID=A0ACD5TQK2_AVESA
MAPSCWFFWLCWWLPMMLTVAAAQEQGEACSAKRCGNLTISDPFWLAGKEGERLCGFMDFEVTCNNNTPVLWSSSSFNIAIIDVSYEKRSLRAVDLGKLELLHASNSCQVPIWTSIVLGMPFRIDPINLNLILYNCTNWEKARQDRELVPTRMMCGNESKMFVRTGGGYDEMTNYEGYAIEGCDAAVMPVLGSSGEANASNYGRLINDGFLVTWKPPTTDSKGADTKIILLGMVKVSQKISYVII